jgi:protein-S-isoprenylcysteine O-methyltransferase Ste14
MTDDERDDPSIVVSPPLIYLGPLVLGLLLNAQLPAPFLPRRVARILGLSLLSGWALLGGWFFRPMHDAGAPIRTDKPVPRLATDGAYRYTRNPGYLSLAMFYAGIASLANALWAILLLPMTLLVIEREERSLERKFDEEYLRYKVRGGVGSE